jgi:DHA2 family multidrug resistance protein-like MFS transporter
MPATAVLEAPVAAPAKSTRIPVLALASASLAMSVDPSVHNIAFVGAANTLGMSGSQRSLIASVGTLCIAATILATGSLGDRLGRKKIMLGGLALAAMAGIVTSIAPNTAVFTLGRVMAGVGYAASFGLSFALLRAVAPDDAQLSRAVAQWLALQTLGVVVLGLLGGYLAGLGWRIAYLLPSVIAGVALLFCIRSVPEARAENTGRFDLIGLMLIAIGLVLTLDGVSASATAGWGSAKVLFPLGIGLVILVAFALYELQRPDPAFPIRLFGDPEMLAAALSGIAFNIAYAVIVLQLSLLWQYLYRYHPFTVSLGLMPLCAASIVGATWVGVLLARGVPIKTLIPVGLFTMAAAIAWMAFAGASTPYYFFLFPLLIAGVGLMFAQTPAARLFVGKAPPELVGAMGSSRTFFGQFGFALGLALSSSLLYGLFDPGLHARMVAAGAGSGDLSQITGIIQAYITSGSDKAFNPQLVYEVLNKATSSYITSYRIMMLTLAGVIAVIGALVYRQLPSHKRST